MLSPDLQRIQIKLADKKKEDRGGIKMKNIRKIMSLCLCMVLALSIAVPAFAAIGDAPTNTTAAVVKFTDVSAGDYFATPVAWAVENGVTAGTTDTTFSPYTTCTELQALQLIYRALGSPKVDEATLTESDRAYLTGLSGEEYDLVAWFMSKNVAFIKADPSITGVIFVGSGYEDISLARTTACQRIRVLRYLYDLAGAADDYDEVADWFVPTGNFADLYSTIPTYVPNDLAAMEAAQRVSMSVHTQEFRVAAWSVENHISAGTTETTFSPYDTCTRAQIASFLYRFFVEQGLTVKV